MVLATRWSIKNRHHVSVFESKFWFFNYNAKGHANTVPLIDRFSNAIIHFSCPGNWLSDNVFFSSSSLLVPAFSCPFTAFTPGCHLHISASLLILSCSRLGHPPIPLAPGRVELNWDAYIMNNLAWQADLKHLVSPPSHSFPSTFPMPSHPFASPGNWVDKLKIKIWWNHSTAQQSPVGSHYK